MFTGKIHVCFQVRHMSDGRKGFFSKIIENIKQEMTVNPEMKVCFFCFSMPSYLYENQWINLIRKLLSFNNTCAFCRKWLKHEGRSLDVGVIPIWMWRQNLFFKILHSNLFLILAILFQRDTNTHTHVMMYNIF